MALNVQWRWSMPAVADPDRVAAGNRDAFSEGIGAIAQGLLKRGENQREQQKLDQAQSNWERQFAAQQDQRQLANMMQNRQFLEQKRMNDQNLANQQFQLQRAQEQQEWMNKFYDKFFANDPEEQEYQALKAKYGQQAQQGSPELQRILMGLNNALF